MALWQELLRAARGAAGLSQAELAARVGVAARTIARLEGDARATPARKRLLEIARALGLGDEQTNAILIAAGLAPLTVYPAPRRRPLLELREMIADWEYPALAHNQRVEIIAWNAAANRVAELDFARDRPDLAQRSLFRIAVDPHFVPRVLNWAEVVQLVVKNFASTGYNILDPNNDPIYFQALVSDLMQSAKWSDLANLWAKTATDLVVLRGFFPAHWLVEGNRVLNFHCIHNAIDVFNATGMIAWYPADGQTWEWLRQSARTPAASPPDETVEEDDSPGRLLRWVRDSTGFTQRELAARANISPDQLASLESNRRPFTEPIVNTLVAALEMDAALANELRLRAGVDPVASDWAAGVINRAPAGVYFRFDAQALAVALSASHDEVAERVLARPYPCLATDEQAAVLCSNALLPWALPAALRPYAEPGAGLLDLLLCDAFRTVVDDWRSVVRGLLRTLLHNAPGHPRPRCDIPEIVRRLAARAAGDSALAALLRELTEDLAQNSGLEWQPVALRLRQDDGTRLSYIAVLTTWNDFETLWSLDLHPADGITWDWLNARAPQPV